MRLSKADAKHFREVSDEYQRVKGLELIEVADAVDWGMENGHLAASINPRDWHIACMSAALQEDSFIGPDGHKIRRRLCIQNNAIDAEGHTRQRNLWGHIDTAPSYVKINYVEQQLNRVRADYQAIQRLVTHWKPIDPAAAETCQQMLLCFNPKDEPGEAMSA